MNMKITKKCLQSVAFLVLFATEMSMEVQASADTLGGREKKDTTTTGMCPIERAPKYVTELPFWDQKDNYCCIYLHSYAMVSLTLATGYGKDFLDSIRRELQRGKNVSAVIDDDRIIEKASLDSQSKMNFWNQFYRRLENGQLRNLIVRRGWIFASDFSAFSHAQGLYFVDMDHVIPMQIFDEVLQKNTILESLCFKNCYVCHLQGGDVVNNIAISLKNNQTLKDLCFYDCRFLHLIEAAEGIAAILKDNNAITRVCISGSFEPGRLGDVCTGKVDGDSIRIIAAAVLRRCLEGKPLELFDAGKVEGEAVKYLHLLKKIVPTDIRFQSSVPDARGEMSAEKIVNEAIKLGLLAEESRALAEASVVLKRAQEKYNQAKEACDSAFRGLRNAEHTSTSADLFKRQVFAVQRKAENNHASAASRETRELALKVGCAKSVISEKIEELERAFQAKKGECDQAERGLKEAKAAYEIALSRSK
ncbi:MAG: hypothetical protein K6C34_03020 [Alphaproteobacteria bacterium]|nr:hypothetical protein [Alphaproteobacteria bacterium]